MVLGTPQNKCEHGVYKAGAPTAEYCGFCNPKMAFTAVPRSTLHIELTCDPEVELESEEVMDAAEFMQQSPSRRISMVQAS